MGRVLTQHAQGLTFSPQPPSLPHTQLAELQRQQHNTKGIRREVDQKKKKEPLSQALGSGSGSRYPEAAVWPRLSQLLPLKD